MEKSKIVLVVGRNTYNLGIGDTQAMRDMPAADRQLLVTLLEEVKQQEVLANAVVQKTVERARTASQATSSVAVAGDPLEHKPVKGERLGSGDVDALMSRLIMEENRSKKPGVTKQSLYMWVAGFVFVVVLLTLLS